VRGFRCVASLQGKSAKKSVWKRGKKREEKSREKKDIRDLYLVVSVIRLRMVEVVFITGAAFLGLAEIKDLCGEEKGRETGEG